MGAGVWRHPPFSRATPKSQNLTETAPAAALTGGRCSRKRGAGGYIRHGQWGMWGGGGAVELGDRSSGQRGRGCARSHGADAPPPNPPPPPCRQHPAPSPRDLSQSAACVWVPRWSHRLPASRSYNAARTVCAFARTSTRGFMG